MKMNIQSAINKELFVPSGELLLVAVEVQRARRSYRSFLSTRKKRDHTTFICVSVRKSKPPQLYITKVKKIGDSSFTRRSQWAAEELRQVNGINPQKDSPEFELVFDNTVDHWVTSSAADKCIFVHVLYCAYKTHLRGQSGGLVITPRTDRGQNKAPVGESTTGPRQPPAPSTLSRTLRARRKSYVPPKQTEFINCQPKLTRDAHRINLVMYHCKALLNRMKNRMAAKQSQYKNQELGQFHEGGMMRNMVQRITVALSNRRNRLTQTEDRTAELMHKAQRFAHAAHQMVLKHSK